MRRLLCAEKERKAKKEKPIISSGMMHKCKEAIQYCERGYTMTVSFDVLNGQLCEITKTSGSINRLLRFTIVAPFTRS